MKTQYHQYFQRQIAEIVHLRGIESTIDFNSDELAILHRTFDQYLNELINIEHTVQYGKRS